MILMSALLITSTVVLAAQGPGSDSSAREFEVRYREWRQEMEEAAPNTVMWTSPPDYAGPARDRIATMGLSAVPIAVERADEPWVTSVFEWITRWHSHGERRKPQGEDRLWVFPEFPDISYGPYDPPDVRLILWRWWEEADVLVPRLFAERYRLWKESVAEGSPEQAARRLQRLRELGVWALPLMIEKVREGDGDLIASVSYLTDGALPADATPRECLDWWEANREHWTVPPPPAERITPEEKAFLQEWRAQRPAAGAARVASVCMRRWLTREQVIGYAGPPAAATADGTLEYECTPGLRLALEFGRNGYVVAATFAQADEAAPAAQEPWTDEER
ncbi:MAG: hypothetical protein GXY85_00735, partial [Candidatus Brocadiaceae bacterium]|nr:hypothetical protein [Candidatus Brocadiaceae bacterium]